MTQEENKIYYIGIDTETSNSLLDEQNKLDLSQSLVYDIGWAVVDENGYPYLKRSFVVAEIFLDKELMSTAYFKDKIPQYWEDIKNKKRVLARFETIRKQFYIDRKKYNVINVFAHNAFFDYKALNNTLRLLTGSKYRFFFPYCIEIWDTLKMSRNTLDCNLNYTDFCDKYNYKTNHTYPQNRYTAEILYRFISGNNDFEESHTGLEDVEIESKIFAYCLKNNPSAERVLFNKKSTP